MVQCVIWGMCINIIKPRHVAVIVEKLFKNIFVNGKSFFISIKINALDVVVYLLGKATQPWVWYIHVIQMNLSGMAVVQVVRVYRTKFCPNSSHIISPIKRCRFCILERLIAAHHARVRSYWLSDSLSLWPIYQLGVIESCSTSLSVDWDI